ncbi:L-serine dehydratase 1 [Planctomycetes bacterium Pan216]|uniref:L-serine dehydratase n=1 Tax=Kolteria novifilia TaxID=2527975 RepID=A0A518B655_9BACT|nr:L-serine dehydratase 1 [Planctomycetes bacterium Pan216]
MPLSVFDLFKVGIGPSSSHTVGPMKAAHQFVILLRSHERIDQVASVVIDLFGSLALTGRGHATDKAVLLGLLGEEPESVDPDRVEELVGRVATRGHLRLGNTRDIPFAIDRDLRFHMEEFLPRHPNAMRLTARCERNGASISETYYSLGGGFILSESEASASAQSSETICLPHPFGSADELLSIGRETGLSIAEIVFENELAFRPHEQTESRLGEIWKVMEACIERGCRQEGTLPGGLDVPRRAHRLYKELLADANGGSADPMSIMDWVSLFALATNEENASGGRVVTAPTNGAAGVIPAVLAYQQRFVPGSTPADVLTFLATAAAIGMLYKQNASISAAEVGCQGEVGVACSMAAAGLAAVGGATNEQIENAAEIGMEHNLGLTCDPVMGLVQIPCIERNTMGATKAITAARLALHGDGTHRISLDKVIATMRQTGADMQSIYKETSLGGLAVNIINC